MPPQDGGRRKVSGGDPSLTKRRKLDCPDRPQRTSKCSSTGFPTPIQKQPEPIFDLDEDILQQDLDSLSVDVQADLRRSSEDVKVHETKSVDFYPLLLVDSEANADTALINNLLTVSSGSASSQRCDSFQTGDTASEEVVMHQGYEVLSSVAGGVNVAKFSASKVLERKCDRIPECACHGVAGCFLWRDESSNRVFCESCWEDFAKEGLVLAEERSPSVVEIPSSPGGSSEDRGWERKESRSQPGTFYWYNKATGVSQFEQP